MTTRLKRTLAAMIYQVNLIVNMKYGNFFFFSFISGVFFFFLNFVFFFFLIYFWYFFFLKLTNLHYSWQKALAFV